MFSLLLNLVADLRLEIAALFLSLHDGRLGKGSSLAVKPLVSHVRYASQVIPTRSSYLCPGNYRFIKVIQRNTVTHGGQYDTKCLVVFNIRIDGASGIRRGGNFRRLPINRTSSYQPRDRNTRNRTIR